MDLQGSRPIRASFVTVEAQSGALQRAERSFYSQNGEDGVISWLAERLAAPPTMVEIGASGGVQCNSRWFRQNGWTVAAFDGDPEGSDWVHTAFVTAENVGELLAAEGPPGRIGVTSIDIDGNDLWILLRMPDRFLPDILVMEYNATVGPVSASSVPYRPRRSWDHSNFFGASLTALSVVAAARGFDLVYCESFGVNAFFVRRELMCAGGLLRLTPAQAYRPPKYGPLDVVGSNVGHHPTTRRFARIDSIEAAKRSYRASSRPAPFNIGAELFVRFGQSDVRRLGRTWISNRWRRARGGGPTK
ncbi:MAG: hypothetical protein JWN39_1789 [Ilumatobacteraceae bacterium]|nr:hypothetical protein [Ilumatobacteraceae bacterium]